MQALENKNQKRNLEYVLDLIKYYFKTGEKPQFKRFILEDTTFLSLVKNIYVAGIIYLALKNFSEFRNTWLERELKKYYEYYKKQEISNEKVRKDIEVFAKKKKVLILRDTAYKKKKYYLSGTRFSSDVDVQIKKEDLFSFHNFLRKKNYLLQNSDFKLTYKPHLYTDGFYDIEKTLKGPFHKKEIINGIKKNYRNFNYYKDSFLEVHIPSSNKIEINNALFWKYALKTNKKNICILEPEIDLIAQANHFFLHLGYNDKQENRLTTFLGFLERLIDLHYILKQNIDWTKIIKLSIEYQVQHQTYYYLNLGKKYLNLNIPPYVLKTLRKSLKFSNKISLSLLKDLPILYDAQKPSIKIYSKRFLKKKGKKPKKNSFSKKERKLILEIISSTKINEQYKNPLKEYNSKKFLNAIKETSLDGLMYHKLKENSSFPQQELSELKKGYEGIKLFDDLQNTALKKIEKIPIEKTLIKDWKYKLSKNYIKGTRYSCDIDILISPEDSKKFDNYLEKNNFYSDQIKLELPNNLKELSWELNKNVSKIKTYYSNLIFYIRQYLFENEKLEDKLKKNRDQFKKLTNSRKENLETLRYAKKAYLYYSKLAEKQYSNKINSILKIETDKDKSINYYSENGAYVDIHSKLFNTNRIINLPQIRLNLTKKSKYNSVLSLEDSIILNSCHFVNNLKKYKEKNGFQGFLKYLLDLKYEDLSKISYSKLIQKSKKLDCSTQVWFYLHLAKKHLNLNISEKALNSLYNNSWILQRFFLNLIRERRLLFNKKSMGVFLYSKTYFENKLFAKLITILVKLIGK